MTRKILYGVQGTGQGHISRARGLAEALRDFDVDVTWLFSGREKSNLFDMAPFGDFKHREGPHHGYRGGANEVPQDGFKCYACHIFAGR
jgi:uncharacterized protein (TIGR00661 family)